MQPQQHNAVLCAFWSAAAFPEAVLQHVGVVQHTPQTQLFRRLFLLVKPLQAAHASVTPKRCSCLCS